VRIVELEVGAHIDNQRPGRALLLDLTWGERLKLESVVSSLPLFSSLSPGS
jgi:hypothetical protein